MEILYLGLLFTEDEEEIMLNNSKVGLANSNNTFQWNIIKGLTDNGNVNLKIVNSIPSGNYPFLFRKLFIRSKKWKFRKFAVNNMEIGFINFYFIKHIIRKMKVYREVLRWVNYEKDREKYIIVYDMYLPFLKVITKLIKKNKIKTCLIIVDLPNEYGHQFKKDKKSLKEFLLKLQGLKSLKLARNFDSYVLLTEHMKYPLKIVDKPSVVLEGIVDLNRKCQVSDKKNGDKKIIMYSGSLNERYGINKLIDAFSDIEDENYELWLCGNGDMNEHIINRAKIDKRIKFFGYVSKDRLLELEKDVTVYINPRNNKGDYTKYSFPSKTIDYLASGKPVIMYKLDGIPNDYDEFVFYIKGSSTQDIKNKICEVCSKSNSELYDIGIKGREFVLSKKNNIIQASKVIELLGNLK